MIACWRANHLISLHISSNNFSPSLNTAELFSILIPSYVKSTPRRSTFSRFVIHDAPAQLFSVVAHNEQPSLPESLLPYRRRQHRPKTHNSLCEDSHHGSIFVRIPSHESSPFYSHQPLVSNCSQRRTPKRPFSGPPSRRKTNHAIGSAPQSLWLAPRRFICIAFLVLTTYSITLPSRPRISP